MILCAGYTAFLVEKMDSLNQKIFVKAVFSYTDLRNFQALFTLLSSQLSLIFLRIDLLFLIERMGITTDTLVGGCNEPMVYAF